MNSRLFLVFDLHVSYAESIKLVNASINECDPLATGLEFIPQCVDCLLFVFLKAVAFLCSILRSHLLCRFLQIC